MPVWLSLSTSSDMSGKASNARRWLAASLVNQAPTGATCWGFSPTTVPSVDHLFEPRSLQIDVMKRRVGHLSLPYFANPRRYGARNRSTPLPRSRRRNCGRHRRPPGREKRAYGPLDDVSITALMTIHVGLVTDAFGASATSGPKCSQRWGNRPASLWIAKDFGCCASG